MREGEVIADQFELSTRQIRRIIRRELGVPPIQLLLTRRLLLAKQLLTETAWPMTEVAFASGFSSVRRFNDAFLARYRMPPSRLRKKATDGAAVVAEGGTSTLQWSVSGVDFVTIDPVGGVFADGSIDVQPKKTTVYRLTATNEAGTATAIVTVTVIVPTPPKHRAVRH